MGEVRGNISRGNFLHPCPSEGRGRPFRAGIKPPTFRPINTALYMSGYIVVSARDGTGYTGQRFWSGRVESGHGSLC